MPELLILKKDLEVIRGRQPLDGIVQFFGLVSPWQDRGLADILTAFHSVNYGQYDEVIRLLNQLTVHFARAGRSPYGWNRTSKGQEVTENNVYLGNIYGLWTKEVSFWKTQKDTPKGGWGFSGMEHLSVYDVVSNQAREFMRSHDEMCHIIGKLNQYLTYGEITY